MKRLDDLSALIERCQCTGSQGILELEEALQQARDFLLRTKERQGIVYVVGNGGSAGIASHFCIDLLNTLGIPASTLVDSNVMTCMANDYGYDHVFDIPLRTLLKPTDLLVAISSSGQSLNILNAVQVAVEKESSVITFSGFAEDNPLRKLGNLNFWLPAADYGLVEMGHFFLLHTLVDCWSISYARQD
jgi:D-sedoheptulose 7-phosphate isomerase